MRQVVPAGTWCRSVVAPTSMRRSYVASTSVRRHEPGAQSRFLDESVATYHKITSLQPRGYAAVHGCVSGKFQLDEIDYLCWVSGCSLINYLLLICVTVPMPMYM